jgi:hypothetical protein
MGVCIVCFLVHAIFILLLAFKIRVHYDSVGDAVFWFLYFVFTEVAPLAATLIIVGKLTSAKKQQRIPEKKALLSKVANNDRTSGIRIVYEAVDA